MIVLAFDTASSTSSVALLRDDSIVFEVVNAVGTHHGETLMPAIDCVMKKADMELGDVELLAATIGPGSFTGLRVGMSTLKGLAYAKSLPAVGVSTLDALARNVAHSSMQVCALLDAKRGEIYGALYRHADDGEMEKVVEDRVSEPRSFFEVLEGTVLFVGNGVGSYRSLIEDVMAERCVFASPEKHIIHASSVGVIGLKKFREGDRLAIGTALPRYLRGSYADKTGKR